MSDQVVDRDSVSGKSTDVLGFLKLVHPNTKGQCFEVRIMNCPDRPGGTYLKTFFGYFTDHEKAYREIVKYERFKPPAIYLTVHPVDPSLYGRAADRIVAAKKGEATPDTLVVKRHLLFIDIDPKRPSGISATDAELQEANCTADQMRDWLAEHGWQVFVEGMSGNGRYLLYRIDLPNNTESYDLISRFYAALKQRYESDTISVDETNKNASRLMKVLGTFARKGDDVRGIEGVDDRPHRQSWYIAHPSASLVVKESIEAISSPPTVASQMSKLNADCEDEDLLNGESWNTESRREFDLARWIKEHNVPVDGPYEWPGSPGGRRWRWTEACPLCGDHEYDTTAPYIGQRGDGKITAGCQHNRCKFTWKDLRAYYEPDAYDKRAEPVTHTDSGKPLYVKPEETIAKAHTPTEQNGESEPERQPKENARPRSKKEEAADRHREKRLDLEAIVSNWEVVCVAGSTLAYRFSGEFFRHSSVEFEVPGEEMRSFAKFQSRLQSMAKTGLHPMYAEVWEEVIIKVVKACPVIESDPECDQRRLVAQQIWPYLSKRTLDYQLYLENWNTAASSYYGVLAYSDKRKQEFMLLVDFIKFSEVLGRDLNGQFEPTNLRHALRVCGSSPRRFHSRKYKFNQRLWVIDKEAMRALGRFGKVGDEDEIRYTSECVWFSLGAPPPNGFRLVTDSDDDQDSDQCLETNAADTSFDPSQFDQPA